MSGEYRKISMDIEQLWETYRKDFKVVYGGFAYQDEESGLEFVFPNRFYKLWNGRPLAPHHMRADNGLLQSMFCQRDADIVDGDFAYVCGTYRENDGQRQFVFSFDTEEDPEQCLPNILIKYSWDKRSYVHAGPIPEKMIANAHVLYQHVVCHDDYDYTGVQYFVVSAAEFSYGVVMLSYYANLGQLINTANANLDHFDLHKAAWQKAFEQVAQPAVESLGGNKVDFTDEEMVATYTDARKNQIVSRYRLDETGWRIFMADPDYGAQVPAEVLDEDGLPLCLEDFT